MACSLSHQLRAWECIGPLVLFREMDTLSNSVDLVNKMPSERVTFYFDPACPWTWNTARWLLDVARERDLSIDWRPLSLTVLNADKEIPPQYRAPMEVGQATLRVVAAMQAAGETEGIAELYTEVGRRLFYDRKQPSPVLVSEAAEAVGLGRFASAATDTSYDEAIEASTHE
ncbi:MAG: DsbA family protein, partial [Candidatus Limnocylindrales bacterium]